MAPKWMLHALLGDCSAPWVDVEIDTVDLDVKALEEDIRRGLEPFFIKERQRQLREPVSSAVLKSAEVTTERQRPPIYANARGATGLLQPRDAPPSVRLLYEVWR